MKAPTSVTVIGLGNWGTSLVHGLLKARVPLHEVIVPANVRSSAGPAGKWLRTLPVTTLDDATLQARILWLCVPDAKISAVTRRLVQRAASRKSGLQRQIVVHSSGALSAQVLEPACLAGALIASVHPVMSFPTRKPMPLQGVPFGIEADPAGRRILNAVVRRLGGRPFAIPAGNKALYHAVGMLASPLLVSHLAAAQQAAALAGFNRRQARQLIEPIVRATLNNAFQNGADLSFSGPIARGDVQTIRLHLQALQPHPMLAAVYRSLALYALEVLPSAGKDELRSWLRP